MSDKEREYESGLKIGLHPLVHPHSRQAEQEMLGRYSALWLEEREEHQSPWCAAALLQAFSLGVHCWPARFVITHRKRTELKTVHTFAVMKGMTVNVTGERRSDEGGSVWNKGGCWLLWFHQHTWKEERVLCLHAFATTGVVVIIQNSFIHQCSSRNTLNTRS